MEVNIKKSENFEKLKKLQFAFDKNIRIFERIIAESIINKEKLNTIKKDLNNANEKFNEAEKCLNELKIHIQNNKIK